MIKLAITHGYRNVGDAIANRIGGETKARPVTVLEVADGALLPLDLSTCVAISAWRVPQPWPAFAELRKLIDDMPIAHDAIHCGFERIEAIIAEAEAELTRLGQRPAVIAFALAAVRAAPSHSFDVHEDGSDVHLESCARCAALEHLAEVSQ